jgi:hypothetical protein
MKNIFNIILLWLCLMVSAGICGTFLSDYLVSINWFGDAEVLDMNWSTGKKYTRIKWGARHYWYNWGVSLLFITSMVRGIFYVNNKIESK